MVGQSVEGKETCSYVKRDLLLCRKVGFRIEGWRELFGWSECGATVVTTVVLLLRSLLSCALVAPFSVHTQCVCERETHTHRHNDTHRYTQTRTRTHARTHARTLITARSTVLHAVDAR